MQLIRVIMVLAMVWLGLFISLAEGFEIFNLYSSIHANNYDSLEQNHEPPPEPEPFPRSDLDDSSVADGTFQDQGPGSVEIYKLDLIRVKPLLDPTPISRVQPNSKSKVPKKVNPLNKEYTQGKAINPMKYSPAPTVSRPNTSIGPKFPIMPKVRVDHSTEVPPNLDPFVGRVPELQTGCEGNLRKDGVPSISARRRRAERSIDFTGRGKNSREIDPLMVVTPVTLDLDYDLTGEEGYEEMDELLKLKELESTKMKTKRGDMDPTLHSDFDDDKRLLEKLPDRGDLGKSAAKNGSVIATGRSGDGNQKADKKGSLHFDKGKRDVQGELKIADGTAMSNQRRKILWFDDSNDDGGQALVENKRHEKRSMWGFGEDEGVVSSNELQTENERRRLAYERWRKEEEERRRREEEVRRTAQHRQGRVENQTNDVIEGIREGYERELEKRQRQEEERLRRLQVQQQRRREEAARGNRWQDEERRRQEVESHRRDYDPRTQTPPSYEEERKRQQQQEAEMRRQEENRLREEEQRRKLQIEEERRRSLNKWREDMRRRQQEADRRQLGQREREWMLKRSKEEEERRRQQQDRNEPSNLTYPSRGTPNARKPYDAERERRMREQEERERQRMLNEYVQRNRPINANTLADRQREESSRRRQEEERRRLEEERKLQEYLRRNQPVRVPKVNESDDGSLEYRRRVAEARQYNRSRYPGPGNGRRNHGPSAPTDIDPRSYVDEARRREAARRMEEERIREQQRQQQEQLRREALRREEEVRRMQSRRYEEDRKRAEAARLEAERRANVQREEEARRSQAGRTRPLANTRPSYEDRRRFEERRRQDTSLIPANLFLNESRRPMELERQRQEYERRRLEAERRRLEASRAKEAREKNEQRTRTREEHLRREEQDRLNRLPVRATIVVRPIKSHTKPDLFTRGAFDADPDINFPVINPYSPGLPIENFPAPPTRRPPLKSPKPCVWAVVRCCSSNSDRRVTCFESMGCPGVNWDPNPCTGSITQAALAEVMKFYTENEDEERRF